MRPPIDFDCNEFRAGDEDRFRRLGLALTRYWHYLPPLLQETILLDTCCEEVLELDHRLCQSSFDPPRPRHDPLY